MSKPRCWNCRKVLQEEGASCAGCGAQQEIVPTYSFKDSVTNAFGAINSGALTTCAAKYIMDLYIREAMRVVRGELKLH